MISVSDKFEDYFLSGFRNQKAVGVFCKSVVVYVTVKMVLLWSLSSTMAEIQNIPAPINLAPRLLLSPAVWGMAHHTLFYSICLVVLLVTLILPWNYLSSGLFFWICLNLTRVNTAVTNGSDLVAIMFAFWCIGMSVYPTLRNVRLQLIQCALFNVSVLFCQVQVVAVYLDSGWDKLLSETWRTGDAFAYIAHFDSLFNPLFTSLVEGKVMQWTLSWMTIVFELSFVVLVWLPKTRIPMLILGVLFHLAITIMLTLPDFGIIMILSYLIFLKDSDYDRIKSFFKRLRQ